MTILDNWNWQPPSHWQKIKTIDLHTEGEPLRVFTNGLPQIKGDTILDKRDYFSRNLDYIRKATMWEPRGHSDMYGAVITPPTTRGSDFGTFFMHNEGYSTMCGHGIIALVTLVLNTGMITRKEQNPTLKIDAPAGKIICQAFRKNGVVQSVTFRNVPSFMSMKNQQVNVHGLGQITFDIGYGGAFYAFVQASEVGLQLEKADHDKLIDYGRRIKNAIVNHFEIKHPFENDLSFLYGTIFCGSAHSPENHSRNVCIFADGEMDRSPTGTGVSARAAIHYAKGNLYEGEAITIESIIGSTMTVTVVQTTDYGPYPAVIPQVGGSAFITGQNEFYFDPDDPLKGGFILR